ncbi:MFS transporter [Actinokineospora fastidiosa]|uniref:MFS transporter n=1 Tax=Actinokineospora fastidiosa TaxID=1816 RepID=A0A918LDM2_9PSEU|nr:MFS transporter [Actinokineospora fastidiosa]GGS35188.1 MFS transporter [Actinokineospora fastidiosa]
MTLRSPLDVRPGYRGLLRSPRRAAMVLAGGVARFPMTGAGVAIVLAVAGATGSYAVAGAASSAYVVLAALAAPVLGRLMDRLGQARVLAAAALVQTAALLTLAAVAAAAHPVVMIALCGVVGLAAPDVGAAVRSRWAFLLRDDGARRTAFLLESVVDETMFVVSPLAVSAAAAVHPSAGLVVVAAGPAFGATALAMQRATAPPPGGRSTAARRRVAVITRPGLPRLALMFLGLGAYLGSIEVLLVAYADRAERPVEAGIALAGWAAGSAGAALVLGARIAAFAPARVLMGNVAVMAAFGLLLPANHGLVWLTAVCFCAGIGASPALSAGFSLASDRAGDDGRTEGMTWMSTGMGFGTTLGALTGGLVADRVTGQEGYLLCSLFGLVALAAAAWAVVDPRSRPR